MKIALYEHGFLSEIIEVPSLDPIWRKAVPPTAIPQTEAEKLLGERPLHSLRSKRSALENMLNCLTIKTYIRTYQYYEAGKDLIPVYELEKMKKSLLRTQLTKQELENKHL